MTHHERKYELFSGRAERETRLHRISSRVTMPMALLAASLATATLSGCAKHSTEHFTVGSVPENYRTKHPIVLEEQERTLDIPVATKSYDLPVASQSAVQGFGYDFKKSASGKITVMLPSGSPNEAAGRELSKKIVATLNNLGIPGNRISTVTYHATDHGSTAPIRLSYGAIQANVTGCGQWPKDMAVSPENRNYHNFGCASQNNLAAMIANPADLIGPRGTTTIDAARRAAVIEDYRTGNDTTSAKQNTVIAPVFEN